MLRNISIKKSISARTTGKATRELMSSIDPYYGKKGVGWIKNPEKALYNYIYNRTTVDTKKVISEFNVTEDRCDNNSHIDYRKKHYSFTENVLQFLFGRF